MLSAFCVYLITADGDFRMTAGINSTLYMALDLSAIKREITEPRKRGVISKAVNYQNRIRFHTQAYVTPNISQPLTDFFAFVSNLLPSDKVKTFKALFRYPLKTNEITAICFNKLSRIFDGRNPAFNYQFANTEQRDDWEYYRQDILHEPEIWPAKGWDNFKTEINSVLVVDMPEVQDPSDPYPQPYFYWLPIDKVITYATEGTDGRMAWIIFRLEDKRIAVIDEERYRVFREENNNIGELLVDNPHDLGYCPARFFWNEPISISEPDIKMSPITIELEALDWYLFYYISKKHLDLHGSYPIYSGYEQSCDYRAQNGDYCDGGFIRDEKDNYKLDSAGVIERCPKCGNKNIAGPGTYVVVPIPQKTEYGEEQPDLRNPVQMLTVDRNSLDYNVAEEERLRNNIITSVIGTNEDIMTREAINEQQVKANFESQSTVLNRIKKGFESAQAFVDETICRLRYGSAFISAKINLGTEFYIYDINRLRERYRIARDSGASEGELDALQNQIIETEYRHNPLQLQRMIILGELEPYRHMTLNEAISLYEKGFIDDRELSVKINFPSYIRRFERENTNILEFGMEIPFSKKINIINQKLLEYASENRKWRETGRELDERNA